MVRTLLSLYCATYGRPLERAISSMLGATVIRDICLVVIVGKLELGLMTLRLIVFVNIHLINYIKINYTGLKK